MNQNCKIIAVRSVAITFIGGLTGSLDVLYITKILKLESYLLGYLSAIQSAVILSIILFAGWLSDNWGRRRMFLLGTGLTLINPLIMAFAPSWEYVFLVYVIGAAGSSLTAPSLTALYISSMKKSERATKIAYVSSLTTIANAVTPPAGAFLIERMGGLPKMRVIYLIQFVATLIVWVYTVKLKDTEVLKTEKGKMLPEILLEIKDTINVLKENRALWWIWIFTIGSFAYGASSPYWILFAAEAYSSPYVVIGLLSTVYSVTNALTLIPVGRFSDRKGRIRAIKYLRPISYLSFAIFLIGYRFKLSFLYLIPLVVWGLRGIGSACSAPCQSAVNEVVPQEFLGRWQALRTFLVSIAGVPSGILGSLLWSINPCLPFLFTFLIEIAIRYPIVHFKLPETLT